MIIQKLLSNGVDSSELIRIKIDNTKSNIIQKNKNIIYCSVYKKLKGLFRKDIGETEEFGRKICDKVKDKMNNNGFFTTDELPAYGINENEVKLIFEKTGAGEKDLVVIFTYNKGEAQKTKEFLDTILKCKGNY